ncbi:putative transcriptional regulatory protein [Lachnellula suecica]|uniref:Putative transcriptional regulatory protein n=1 Tax=Lachnellula suecica TaxID=602035 RepID=A0A8T9CAN3_9HELO|nr:putative transcriptional regulatory protein [Lachnellula suecica]
MLLWGIQEEVRSSRSIPQKLTDILVRGPSKRTADNELPSRHLTGVARSSAERSPTDVSYDEHAASGHRIPRPPQNVFSLSPEISKMLFQTYFDCIHPTWPLLYKPLYTSADYTYPSPGIPAALVMAIFAIASCLDNAQTSAADSQSAGFESRRCPEPSEFFERAFTMLGEGNRSDREHLSMNAFVPSITNIQVLVILALQQHSVAEYSRAALLIGLSVTMAIELRIHRAYEPDDPVEQEVRSRLWWNLYILEKMMSTEMGRPILLRYEESDCPWPSVSESDEFELMPPQTQFLTGQTRNRPIKMRTISALHTTISLTRIMERISRKIYGVAARKAIRENQDAGENVRMQLWLELQSWEEDMDASPLRLDLSDELTSAPPTVTNYVIMLTGTMLVHRPFTARWRSDDPTTNPYDVCLEAANRICLILERYMGRLPGGPCDMVFSIFTAASIFLHHSKQVQTDTSVDTHRRLKQCIDWLSILGKSWQIAGARQQLLNDMFDIPQALQEPRSVETTPAPQIIGQSSSQPGSRPGSLGNLLNPVAAEYPPLQSQNFANANDWSFLRDFGDSTDQFYSWDVDLRHLLDGGHNFQGNEYTSLNPRW